jgi:hypothetical protein
MNKVFNTACTIWQKVSDHTLNIFLYLSTKMNGGDVGNILHSRYNEIQVSDYVTLKFRNKIIPKIVS